MQVVVQLAHEQIDGFNLDSRSTMRSSIACFTFLFALIVFRGIAHGDTPWTRRVIDDAHQGADGVRLGDFNQDGWQDVVTGWEESGLVKLYLNPGPERSQQPWPAVTVAKAASPEDAVPIDVDGDGQLDIVSSHEGKQRQLLVHWNGNQDLLSSESWTTDRFPQLDGVMWMFATPLGKINSRTAIVVGSKGPRASISLLLSPPHNPRDLATWTTIRLRDAGWIMSLRASDMDGDGDQDVVFTDRKGNKRMAGWLEQPDTPEEPWQEHLITGTDKQVMFLSATPQRCLVAMRENEYADCTRTEDGWNVSHIANPPNVPFGKAVEVLPDGSVILTSNTAASPHPNSPGIWIRNPAGKWSTIDPTTKVKFDRMELIDLDDDGDLDVMTCEERQNLGVIWYENPGVQ